MIKNSSGINNHVTKNDCDKDAYDKGACSKDACDKGICDKGTCDKGACDKGACDKGACVKGACDKDTCDKGACDKVTCDKDACNKGACDKVSVLKALVIESPVMMTRGAKATDTEDADSGQAAADGGDDSLVASAAASSNASTPKGGAKNAKKVKFPCGKCDAESTGMAVKCHSCDQWYHFGCVEGMNKDWFDSCKKTFEAIGTSAFLCKTCRKVSAVQTKVTKELRSELKEVKDKVMVLEMQNEALAQKLENLELKIEKANSKVENYEKEVSSTVEKAKEEVRTEITKRDERGSNIVVFGLEETKEPDTKKWKEEEQKKVEELLERIEVVGKVQVQHRAGKPRAEGENPRPLIVKVADDETREKVFRNASKLSRVVGKERVYINYDLTPQQREEEKRKETELKEEATRKTEAEEGSGKKFIVVGSRGRRRVVEERRRD